MSGEIAARYDAVIAGAGLSGLSLAAHLAASGWRDRSVLLVDDASAPAAQCWASWSRAPGLLDAAVTTTYEQIRVHAGGRSRVLPLGSYRYRLVRRADLRRTIAALISQCPGFELRVGRVERIHDGGEAAETVINGQVVRSTWAFDSVGPPPTAQHRDARLAFTGWEVRYPRPVFEPDTPVLFDFRTPQDGGTRFVYVLPDDPHRALVELTAFVPRHGEPPEPDARDAALSAYLRDVVGGDDYEVLRAESAVLPLRAFPPPRRHGRVLAIGASAGLLKATTGYAYQRIQRDSAAITESLVRHGHPFALPAVHRRHRLLDAILLEALDHDPARLEEAFARLFFTNPAERVLAFLDEDTDRADELRLIATLPKVPYLRAAATRAVRGMRPTATR
jgi:lycopene beta-cyclase